MRTIIYIDGFNLYFKFLEKRPALKWLNVKALAERLLKPTNQVIGVKYYTARVSGRIDPAAPARQQLYLDALRTVPEISIHMGTFLLSEKFAGLVKPPEFRPSMSLPLPETSDYVVAHIHLLGKQSRHPARGERRWED